MTSRRAQQGFSLIAAIFLIVVLASLAVYGVRLTTLQNQTVTAGLRAAQAYQAARSGAAWAAYRAVNAGACVAPPTLSLTEGGTAGFNVSVQCTRITYVEGPQTVHVFVLDVRATAGAYGTPDYVSRRLQTKVTDAS
jgi:MSHA biogenesis protein MshP